MGNLCCRDGDSESDGDLGTPQIRKFTRGELVGIANDNDSLRANWSVPLTVAISNAQCNAALPTFGPGHDAPITFSDMYTGDALLYFCERGGGLPVCGFNFANGQRVGGGYKTGATAQEEDLCRQIPNLWPSLKQAQDDGLYPFGPPTHVSPGNPGKYSDVLYTDGLVVARTGSLDGYELLPADKCAAVSLVTGAAPNINFANDVYDLELMYETVKTVFIAPLLQARKAGEITLVLGAWGCGAFGCHPKDIADLFVRALTQDRLGRLYREVHFAIPPGPNAEAFKEVFRARNVAFSEYSR